MEVGDVARCRKKSVCGRDRPGNIARLGRNPCSRSATPHVTARIRHRALFLLRQLDQAAPIRLGAKKAFSSQIVEPLSTLTSTSADSVFKHAKVFPSCESSDCRHGTRSVISRTDLRFRSATLHFSALSPDVTKTTELESGENWASRASGAGM